MKLYCLGEALVDIINGVAHVGGAPANVAACAAKLGMPAAFVGGISDDEYGKLIAKVLTDCGVDMRYAALKRRKTAIAKVTLTAGERVFSFERENTADLSLKEDDVTDIKFVKGDILHFSSNCLMNDDMLEVHEALIRRAKREQATISYDPNLRPSLWENERSMPERAAKYLAYADIVKLSDEEACTMAEYIANDYEKTHSAAEILQKKFPNIKALLITCGKYGAHCYSPSENYFCAASNERAVDTTGAGDCFAGAFLTRFAGGYDLENCIKFASAACAVSVSRYGAIDSYPTAAEAENFV